MGWHYAHSPDPLGECPLAGPAAGGPALSFFEPRIFTREEASALLPRLRPILKQLTEARERLRNDQAELETRFHGGRGNGHPVPGGELDRLHGSMATAQAEIDQAVQSISELGCELKDPDRGMIDFRTH